LGGVGDNLIAASVLRPLKEMGYKVEMITEQPHGVLFENNPYIDKLSVHDKEEWKLVVNDQMTGFKWFAHRAKEFDLFANLSMSCEYLCVTPMAHAPFWWPQEFRRKLYGRSYIESVHDISVRRTPSAAILPTEEESAGTGHPQSVGQGRSSAVHIGHPHRQGLPARALRDRRPNS
jgi:hypothetical protein